MKQAITYERFSPRPDADTSLSCEKQLEKNIAYCKLKEYSVVNSFPDKDVSGGILNRPKLQEAIDSLKPGMILVVASGDRLARDMLVELTIINQVEAKGCTVEYADGSPTRSTPEGNLFRNILAAFSQYERERIQRNTKSGLAKKKNNGQHLGRAPIGWRYNKETKCLEGNHNEMALIAKIKSMSHFSSTEIADYMNRHGYSLRGKPWSARTIRKILANN